VPPTRVQTSPAKGSQVARFSPPRGPLGAVERTPLIARIERGDARITLICAPAGFGKTTLMQQLRRALQLHGTATVWLRVDEGDNALGRFLQSLIGAMQLALPQFVPPDFASTPLAPAGSTQGLAADLLDRVSLSESAIALCLDDLELITAAETCEFLQRLLANLGPHHRVVIGSRTPPPLSLGRLRAHGLLLELTHTDLRFTPEETTSFLKRRDIPAAAALRLQRRTEGWPAALQLAAISFGAKGKSATEWLESYSGSTDSVADYLAQEVLESRPLSQREFLLRSSVLGDFCAPMCDAALARDDSAAMIAQVLCDNLLLSTIDVEQGWYRYHPLFADFLRAQLEREAPGDAQALHRAAALWAAEEGLTHEAVTHALAAQDRALAASVFESSALGLVLSGRVAEAARIITQLPDAEVTRRPALLRAGAFAAVFAHRYSAATRFIELLEHTADGVERPADDELSVMRHDELFAMRLMLLAWTDRVPEMYARVSHNLEPSRLDGFTAGLASNASAFCNISLGRHLEAERDLARARRACEPIHALYVLSYSACFSAQIELIRGNAPQARQILETGMNRAIAEGQRHGSAGAVVATHLAELRYEANDLDACEVLVNDYLAIVVETGLPDHLILMHRLGTRLHFHFGRPEAGYALLADLHEIGIRRNIARLSAASWLERAYVALRSNDPEEARRSLALGADPSIWKSFGQFQLYAEEIEDPLIARVRLELVLGIGEQTVPLLQTALLGAEAGCRQRRALRLRFLLAQTLERLGRRGEAIEAFDGAITRASALGLMRCLADENWSTRSLIRRSSTAGDARAAALLRELDSHRDPAVQATRNALPSGTPTGISRLSNRELQVLRLLGRGQSNKVIARELFVSENTIETHLRRIYEKLGTHNRTEAAALAREAGAI
jgi:LuxR family maltose regulon positive regulatory protein